MPNTTQLQKYYAMKTICKTIIIVLASLLMAGNANAQNYNVEPGTWSIDAGMGPISAAGNYAVTGAVLRPFAEVFAVIFTFGLYKPEENYDEYHTSPGFSLRGGYQVNPWLMVTGDLNYGAARADRKEVENGPTISTDHWKSLSLLPGVHFTYLNKGKWQLYSGLAAGAAFLHEDDGDDVLFTFEAIPFGARFGKKVYGSAELNWGSEFGAYFRAGVGIRF